MPYTLDLMRHRDQFRRRGLKPVHNPDAAQPPRAQQEDEQYQADEEEEPEIDADERYIPPKDLEERPPKRPRTEKEHDGEEEHPIRLKIGRKKFIDPRQFNVPPKVRQVQQVTPAREEEVRHCGEGAHVFRIPISTSLLMMKEDFLPRQYPIPH